MFVVIGTSTVDLFVEGLARLPSTGGEHFQATNLSYTDKPLRLTLGGNGANAAFALARLGAEVRLASAVGDDALGRMVEQWLSEAGVDVRWLVRSEEAATSTAMLVVDAQGNRLIFHHPGAYEGMRAEDLPTGWCEGARSVLIGGYSHLHGMRPAGSARLLAEAKAAGAVTAVDIGPAVGDFARLPEVAQIAPHVDYLIANEHEVLSCAGIDDMERAQEALLESGVANLIVKRGERGSRLCRPGERYEVAALPASVRQTVGAGDAFNAGFLYGLDCGQDVHSALRFASATAAQIVASPRGMLDAPSRMTVEAALAASVPPGGGSAQ